MRFISSVYTDIGIKKKTNQDSALVIEAQTENDNIMIACICDGMGGLAKGEVASGALVRSLADWFQNSFPPLYYSRCDSNSVRQALNDLLISMSRKIMMYGRSCGVSLGTTACVLLLCGNRYFVSNVGDSRAYVITERLYQITKDQTYIQREMDLGRMTYEEAMVDPQRNVLLQCIGASDIVEPDFYEGQLIAGQEFLLCSDGFRHIISPEEIYNALYPPMMTDEAVIRDGLRKLTELNKARLEVDNITSVLIKTE